MDLIIFAFTNAYDVYSAAALNEVNDCIDLERIDEGGYLLLCNNANKVEDIMKEYAFTYERHNNVSPTDDIKPSFKNRCHHVYRSIGNFAEMCDWCGDMRMIN